MTDKRIESILTKVFNCGASQCMSIYSKENILTPEKALDVLYDIVKKAIGKEYCYEISLSTLTDERKIWCKGFNNAISQAHKRLDGEFGKEIRR